MNPFKVVEDFEQALCEYTGAPFCVTTSSCTMALLLAAHYHLKDKPSWSLAPNHPPERIVSIPKHTYVGVPMSIIHAGGWPSFRNERWAGWYQLEPLPIWDSARWLFAGMYKTDGKLEPASWARYWTRGEWAGRDMVCLSFHWSKTLGISQGGAILHSDPVADEWLRKARFDGRTAGVPPTQDKFYMIGWHAYMSPEVAAAGLVRLANLPSYNAPLPWDDYPDLSQMEIFK